MILMNEDIHLVVVPYELAVLKDWEGPKDFEGPVEMGFAGIGDIALEVFAFGVVVCFLGAPTLVHCNFIANSSQMMLKIMKNMATRHKGPQLHTPSSAIVSC